MQNLRAKVPNEEHEQRMRQARARAIWEVGSQELAEKIVHAYLFPTRDEVELRTEQQED